MASEGPKKKSRVDEESVEEELKPLLDELEPLEQALIDLTNEEEAAMAAVNKEFNKKRAEVYKKRGPIISKIPGFWLKCFENHPSINNLIEDDKEILKHLLDVQVEDLEEGPGGGPSWKITFTFEKNPYFTTTTLWKEFHYQPEDEEIKVTGNQIEWHKGQNPKEKKKKESEKKKDKKGKKRTHEEEAEDEEDDKVSFFDWFNPADSDDHLGEVIREELWPNAIAFFLGQVNADEDDDDEEGEGEEGEGEGEGGGDDDGEGGDD